MKHEAMSGSVFFCALKKRGRVKQRTKQENFMPEKTNSLGGALKMREARAYLGNLSVPTIHRLIKRGLLRPNRSTRHLLFTIRELDRFLREGMQ